jgi:hypothetical protein
MVLSHHIARYIYLHISTSSLEIVAIGHYASQPTLVQLMETLLKDIHKKVPYGFACGSEISSAN